MINAYDYLCGLDSQQSDEIEISQDFHDEEEAVNLEREDFELNTQDAEEFDTDLPAEHNVRNQVKVNLNIPVKAFCVFLLIFFSIKHCSILAIWSVYRAFSILNQTKHTAYPYFSMTPSFFRAKHCR